MKARFIIKRLILIIAVALFSGLIFINIVSADGIQTKIDEIKQEYPDGSYFTADGGACYSSQASNCRLKNIPARGGLLSGAAVSSMTRDSWSCRSFATYCFYQIFGEYYAKAEITDKAVLGDLIYMNGISHSAIFLSEDDTSIYVYDSNGDNANGVGYNKAYRKSKWNISTVYHANSYDEKAKESVKEPVKSIYSRAIGADDAKLFIVKCQKPIKIDIFTDKKIKY